MESLEKTPSLEVEPPILLSYRKLKPLENGGVVARVGFHYQDHVAAELCCQMLENISLAEVWCETLDDITLVWNSEGKEEFEFVQVKNEQKDSLWSVARLCQRDGKKDGSSLLERSLAYARGAEPCRFRLVTSQGVNSELIMLTHPFDTPIRDPNGNGFKALENEISKKVKLVAPTGMTARDWLAGTRWEHCQSEDFLSTRCKLQLTNFAIANNRSLAPDQMSEVHNRVLQIVNEAARSQYSVDPKRKRIEREDFIVFVLESIDRQVNPHKAKKGETLERKMSAAGISPEHISNAQEQRRYYLMRMRSTGYLELNQRETVEARARQDFSRLLLELDTGDRPDEGLPFYKACLDGVETLGNAFSSAGQDLRPYLEGFLYEQAERCVHRFTRVKLESR